MNRTIVLIDPQSYNNLAEYDTQLLNNINYSYKILIGNTKYLSRKRENNFQFIGIFDYTQKKSIFRPLSYIISLAKCYSHVKMHSAVLVHFQWFKIPLFDYLLIKILKRYTNAKVVFTAHNLLPHDTGKKYLKVFKKMRLELLRKLQDAQRKLSECQG